VASCKTPAKKPQSQSAPPALSLHEPVDCPSFVVQLSCFFRKWVNIGLLQVLVLSKKGQVSNLRHASSFRSVQEAFHCDIRVVGHIRNRH